MQCSSRSGLSSLERGKVCTGAIQYLGREKGRQGGGVRREEEMRREEVREEDEERKERRRSAK